jgi:hypothetical protein
MASHLKDTLRKGRDHPDNHASDNRWRHQESSSYAKHAAQSGPPREADERNGTGDLTNFLQGTRVQPTHTPSASASGPKYTPLAVSGDGEQQTQHGEGHAGEYTVRANGGTTEVLCGPLLNYRRMENETWFGSVLVVTRGGGLGDCLVPELKLKIGGAQTSGPIGNDAQGARDVNPTNFEDPASQSYLAQGGALPTVGSSSGHEETTVKGTRLYSDPVRTFWRFDLQVPMQQAELRCEYSLPGLVFSRGTKTGSQNFFIPAISESMRIMFHSCNGFSVGTDEAAWSGPALWNDVVRVHAKTPFHIM